MASPEEEFIEQVAKQLPVKELYNDALSPAAREAGGLGADLIKALRIQLTAVALDRFRRFINDTVNRVPTDKQLAPEATSETLIVAQEAASLE